MSLGDRSGGAAATSWKQDLKLGLSHAAGWLDPDVTGAYERVKEMWDDFDAAKQYIEKKVAGTATPLDDYHAVFTVAKEAKNHAFSSRGGNPLASELSGRAIDTIEQHGQGLFNRVEGVFDAAFRNDPAAALAQSDYSEIEGDLLGQFCLECIESLNRLRGVKNRVDRTTDAISSFFK